MISRPTTSLSSITLTAREHEEMRNCITRLQRLGLKDNKAVNLVNRNAKMIQPLFCDFLTCTLFHRLLDIITRYICKQTI